MLSIPHDVYLGKSRDGISLRETFRAKTSDQKSLSRRSEEAGNARVSSLSFHDLDRMRLNTPTSATA